MNKKQLFKIALISSPIMAAFEISPVFFLVSEISFRFWEALLVFTLLSLVIWVLNILLISIEESKKPDKTWKRYILSYIYKELANKVYEQVKLQFDEGMASLTDLLNVETSLLEAENLFNQQLLRYKLAEIEILKTTGKLQSLINN